MKPQSLACATLLCGVSLSVHAATFEFSFDTDETVGGTEFSDGDILVPTTSGLAVSISGAPLFSTSNEDIDAYHLFADGSFVFSTAAGATIADGGVGGILSGDLILFDPSAPDGSKASTFLDDFGPDVDGVSVDENGLVYIAFSQDGTFDGTSFEDQDFLTFDLSASAGSQVTKLFDVIDLFPLEASGTVNPDALSVLDGILYFSLDSAVTVAADGGDGFPLEFNSGTIFFIDLSDTGSFDPVNDVFLTANELGALGADFDALNIIPEPSSLLLLGAGTLLACSRRGHRGV